MFASDFMPIGPVEGIIKWGLIAIGAVIGLIVIGAVVKAILLILAALRKSRSEEETPSNPAPRSKNNIDSMTPPGAQSRQNL